MSINDILFDKIKDRLYKEFHDESLRNKLFGDSHPPLKNWNSDYVVDLIDNVVKNYEPVIKILIEKTVQDSHTKADNLDCVIQEIVEKIKSFPLILNEKQKPFFVAPDSKIKTSLPFTARSLLQMCWGMTLNFSHYSQEATLGTMFTTNFNETYKQVFLPNYSANLQDLHGNFLLNLRMALSSSTRNLGFIRGQHVEYLSFNLDRVSTRRKHLEAIADFASFSGSGVFAKLGTLIGIGSLADLVAYFQKVGLSVIYISIFATFGIMGAFGLTLVARAYVDRTDDTWDRNIRKDQNRYWKEHYKKDVTNELYKLYESIIRLIERFYPDKDEIIQNDELLRKYINPEYVKKIISEEIIAPDDLQWFPIVQTSNSQGGSSQSSQSAVTNSSSTTS